MNGLGHYVDFHSERPGHCVFCDIPLARKDAVGIFCDVCRTMFLAVSGFRRIIMSSETPKVCIECKGPKANAEADLCDSCTAYLAAIATPYFKKLDRAEQIAYFEGWAQGDDDATGQEG